MPFNVCTEMEDCGIFHHKNRFHFYVNEYWSMGIAVHGCVPLLLPATTSGWNWSQLTWELIWQTSLSPESL